MLHDQLNIISMENLIGDYHLSFTTPKVKPSYTSSFNIWPFSFVPIRHNHCLITLHYFTVSWLHSCGWKKNVLMTISIVQKKKKSLTLEFTLEWRDSSFTVAFFLPFYVRHDLLPGNAFMMAYIYPQTLNYI